GARAKAGIGAQLADVAVTPVIRTYSFVQDAIAHRFLQFVGNYFANGTGINRLVFGHEAVHDLFAQHVHGGVALVFVRVVDQDVDDPVAQPLADAGRQLFVFDCIFQLSLFLADGGAHLFLQVDKRLQRLVAELQRLDEKALGNFVGARFDHDNRIAGGGDPEVERTELHLWNCRIGDELAVNVPNAHGADRPVPGNVGDVQRGTGGVDRHNVEMVEAIRGESSDNQLHLVAHTVGEEGAQRAVGQPVDEDGVG